MKKILTALLVLALMLGVMVVTVGAAGTGSASLSADTKEAQPGDTFTVKFSINSNLDEFRSGRQHLYRKCRDTYFSGAGQCGGRYSQHWRYYRGGKL